MKIAEAGIMLIIKDGLILCISRRNDSNKFGIIGGKKDESDLSTKEAAIRETKEEAGLTVKECVFLYERLEPGKGPNPVDHISRCYYATEWEGEPVSSDEGDVLWLNSKFITSDDHSPFSEYNRYALNVFREMFPNVNLK